MKDLVGEMIGRLSAVRRSDFIAWAAPVPSFGPLTASVGTLGINPSNREFVDENGVELTGVLRRFHTLNSLKLPAWTDAGAKEVRQIVDSCVGYFCRNPYNGWFKKLDAIVAGTGHSYYDSMFPACHIDLLPFATDSKWGALSSESRTTLLRSNSDLLRAVLRAASLEVLILNGQSVVSEFAAVTGASLKAEEMPTWRLPRRHGPDVMGIAYRGTVCSIDGIALPRSIHVLGFNHNIQSSFGVTSAVVRNIAEWVNEQTVHSHAKSRPVARSRPSVCA